MRAHRGVWEVGVGAVGVRPRPQVLVAAGRSLGLPGSVCAAAAAGGRRVFSQLLALALRSGENWDILGSWPRFSLPGCPGLRDQVVGPGRAARVGLGAAPGLFVPGCAARS